MAKTIVAVNAGPRKGWNTDMLVNKAAEGAASKGAEIQHFDLYKLEKYSGCISCFGCKLNGGKCVCRDGLSPVLDAIREADGLIIGTPNYLGNGTAAFRALYERLVFQYITYRTEPKSCNQKPMPVLFIMTSNAPEAAYQSQMEAYKKTFDAFIGPASVMRCGETLQVNNYDRFDWTMFDPQQRKERHETVFPKELEKAYALGAELA